MKLEYKLDEIRRRKEERERKHNEWIVNMKNMKTPLYQKIEEQYEENIVLPQILQERQKLNQIKELHHRVDLNEIKLHQLRHKEQKMLIEQSKSDRLIQHRQNNNRSVITSMKNSPSISLNRQLVSVRNNNAEAVYLDDDLEFIENIGSYNHNIDAY
jgi:hypothetical protein